MSSSPSSNQHVVSYRVPSPVDGHGDSGLSPIDIQISREERERRLLNWVNQRDQEGLTYLGTQAAWPHIQNSVDRIYSQRREEIPDPLSHLSIDQVKHDITEIVATYANFRPIADYQCRNKHYQHQAKIYNDLYLDWHFSNSADRWWRKGMQNSAVKGTGWISPRWTKGMGDTEEGRVVLDIYDHKGVRPIQIGADNDIQGAYGCIIVDETPIARAHAKHPQFQDRIFPDRQAPTRVKRAVNRLRRAGSIVFGIFGRGGKLIDDSSASTFPTVDIFSVYVKDQSINMTGRPVQIGGDPNNPQNSWAYIVPSFVDETGARTRVGVGSPIVDPVTNTVTYHSYKDITEAECRLYPRGRLIVCTRTVVLWDGPNPYWHGRFPVAPITFDLWPDQLLGFPLTMSVLHIEDTINKLSRMVENASAARLNPPMETDDAVDEQVANQIVPSMPGQKWRVNRLMGEGVKFPFPYQFYDVPQFIPAFIESLSEKIRQLLGLADVQALARARQIPSADTVDKLLEQMGPIVEDRARAIESAVVEVGNQMLSHFMQFYTIERRLRILGPDGVTWEDIDYDPANLIPSDFPGRTRAEKAQAFMRLFHFNVTPRSLHEINSLTRRMLLLQLYRSGFPIDSQTVGEACDIPRLGEIPGDTVFQKFIAENEIKAMQAIRLQRLQAMAVPQGGQPAPMDVAQMVAGALQQLGTAQNGGHEGVGRKPSGEQPPQLINKSDGRAVISESGRGGGS